jgi:hypothetical protein
MGGIQMRNFLFSTTGLAAAAACTLAAQAQTGPQTPILKCADFRHNSDGSWAPLREVTIRYPNGIVSLGPEISFPATGSYMGLPLAQMLTRQCGSR